MDPDIIIGLLVGLLAASILLNLFLYGHRRGLATMWRERAREAEDAKHAAELRSDEQIDAMLARVASRQIELRPATPVHDIDPDARLYIADTDVSGDAAWNDFRGEPEPESDDIPEEFR